MSVATLPKGWGLDGPRIHSSYGTDHGLSITDTAKALSTHLYGQTKLVARLKQSPSRMADPQQVQGSDECCSQLGSPKAA